MQAVAPDLLVAVAALYSVYLSNGHLRSWPARHAAMRSRLGVSHVKAPYDRLIFVHDNGHTEIC